MIPQRLRDWALTTKRELRALYHASRHPNTPPVAKWLAGLVLLYALSPIDLIPDFVPVLGYLDDAVLIPLGIVLVIRLVPNDVWCVCRERARIEEAERLPRSRWGAVLVVAAWAVVGLAAAAIAAALRGEK